MLIRGAGDLATGVAHRLYRAGFSVVMTELPEPLAVRRTVAFSECVFRGRWTVEGVEAVRVDSPGEALVLLEGGGVDIPVIVDPEGRAVKALAAPALVDARMAKRNLGTTIGDAQVVIGLGPGFVAGVDAHAVVETARGHYLGRAIYRGAAQENTGIPGEVEGYSSERVLRAPGDGVLRALAELGSRVGAGEAVAEVGRLPVRAKIDGVLRGLLRDGAPVREGQKIGDIDPRIDPAAIWHISDKARAVGGGVLEAVTCCLWGRVPGNGGEMEASPGEI